MKTYLVGNYHSYTAFLEERNLVDNIEEANIVLFAGGEDINPKIYNKKAHPTTYFNRFRDKMEIQAFKQMKPNQLAVGICRGAQLFCALYGGILVQDCDNHWTGYRHMIVSLDGKQEFSVTSLHHQMQYPFDLPETDYEILFKSKGNQSTFYEGDGVDPEKFQIYGEPEVVVYHRPGLPTCFGIQGHPEMMLGSKFCSWVNQTIRNYVSKL